MLDAAWIDGIVDWAPPQQEQRRCACGNRMASTSGLDTCQRCVDREWRERFADGGGRSRVRSLPQGVVKHGTRFAAQLYHRGVTRHLGMCASAEEAAFLVRLEKNKISTAVA